MMIILYVYLIAGVIVGMGFAAHIRYTRWCHDTGRKKSYEPNKDGLAYVCAISMMIPIMNLLWVYLVLTYLRDEYVRKTHKLTV